ncbi:phage tail tape measure protein [Glutamicibacter arilaitensis]|uniref:Phage tail tape measure protein n=1 Tax=Glutamicibacter arilaitensis TaxID=256701 RepID=A0A4Y8TYJ5_9MICC|nr:phage tail tape measure protein [Glutamicibacter arilaitensis]TFH57275.1 phage tail tape measure protein [Glutamicibacter arilaitensis]
MARTVKLEIDAKVTGLINGLKTAQKATQDSAREFDKWAAKHEDSLETVGKGMTAFGLVAAGGATLAVKKFADFDKAMSSVEAATHESTTNMGLLRQAAIDAGADTAFSAEEAARGIEELAKAGVSTADVMSGGLTGALNLAAAGELGVGEAAEIAATAMTQFKLSGDQIPHLADLLAAGAGKAQGGVRDLGAALNQSGLVASATGLTIEETTGTLAAFASAGLIGSDAGTSFKSMLQRLQNPSKESAREMEKLGLSMYDANGEFAGMDVLAGQLASSLANKSSAERDAAMATIFGADAVRAANVLYEQGAQGIQDWTNKVNDAGYAADTAAIMQNNLAGDLEKLGGAFDTVFIQSGGAANDALRGLVQTAESVVDAVGKIPAPILGVGTVIGGLAGGAALLGGGLITVLPKIRDTRDAMNDLFPAGSRGANGLNKVKSGMADLAKGAAVAGGILTVGVAIGKLAEMSYTGNIIEGTGHVAVKLQEIIDKAPSANSALDEIFKGRDGEGLTQSISGVDDAIDAVFGDSAGQRFNRWGENLINATTGIKGSVEIAEDAFRGMDAELANLVNGGNADGAAQAMDTIMQKLKESGVSAEEAAYLFPQYADALNRVDAESQAAAGGSDVLAGALDGVGAEAEETAASLDDILASLFELGVLTRDVRASEADFEAAIDGVTDSIEQNGKSLDITTEKGRANQAALDGLASSGQAYTESLAQSGASEKELQDSMQGTYDSLITAAGQFGITGEKATALAREIMGVPDGVSVDSWMSDSAKQIADGTAEAIAAIPGYAKVSIAVSEDGTVGQVQSRINEVTGKTEYVFVTDDGTVQNVQAGIANIDGKDVPVYVGDDGTVYSTQGKINGIKGKDVTIVADAATGAAEAALNNAARDRVSVIRQRVVNGGSQESTGRGGRGGLTRASGGAVFGPGTETSDSIPAWLSTNEHVLSAREVRGLGGHDSVERLRAMARNGQAPGFATGGAVGRAEKRVKDLQKSYSAIDGKKANKARKQAAKDQLDAAKEELKSAKSQAKLSADAAKDAREKASRLSESRRELRTDLRRGSIVDSFTGGNGLSQVDKLFEASRDTDRSRGARRAAARDAAGLEKALASLTKRSEGLEKALEAATDKADELRSVRDAVANDLRGEFSLSGMLSETRQDLGSNPFTAKSISSKANKMARRIEIFAGRLNRLRKLGYGETIIQEIAALGTEDGILAAGALMDASKSERNSIIKAYDRLDDASGKAGQYVTESMYKGGLDAADGLVRGLESKNKNVENAFYKLGKNAEKSFKRSLGIKSPSRVMMAAGVNVGEGAELGILSKVGDVQSAAEQLMTPPALTVPPSYEVSRYASAQAAPASVSPEAIAQAVQAGMAGWQPVVNIGGTKFYGVMAQSAKDARKPLK